MKCCPADRDHTFIVHHSIRRRIETQQALVGRFARPAFDADHPSKFTAPIMCQTEVPSHVTMSDRAKRAIAMPHLERAKANMEVVLEQACKHLPHGGENKLRAFIMHRLVDAVQSGLTTLGELGIVARRALADHRTGRSGSSAVYTQVVDLGRVDGPPSPNDGVEEQ